MKITPTELNTAPPTLDKVSPKAIIIIIIIIK